VELADTLRLERSARKGVGVQIPRGVPDMEGWQSGYCNGLLNRGR
jgi:hypothetical protein